MRVWLVNHYALPPSETGITRHHDLAVRLNSRGFDISIIASSFDHYRRVERVAGSEPFSVRVEDGVRYCWVSTPAYGEDTLGRVRNMSAFAARLALGGGRRLPLSSPDAIVGSSPHLLAPLAARRLARHRHIPFVLEVRDIWPESLVELGGPPRWHPAIVALGRIERSLYRTADTVVSVLPLAAPHIRERAGRDVDVEWIPNGAPAPQAAPPPPSRRGGPLSVVYAGTIGHANALDVVIDAAAELERTNPGEVEWRVVGLGPDRDRLIARCAELKLSSVDLPGPVPRTDIPRVLAEADVCLLHLMDSPVFRWGVSPNKLFDYFSAARPVIFAVRTPASPVNEAGAGLTIPPQDPGALAGAVRQMITCGASTRSETGILGYEYLRKHHDLEVIADRYADLLTRIR